MSTKYSEKVMMIRGNLRILRIARDYRSYRLQRRIDDGLWIPVSGPWCYYANAKQSLRDNMP